MYFYLLLGGITPTQVINANGQIVTASNGGNISLQLSLQDAASTTWTGKFNSVGEKQTLLKITLKGPNKNSTNKSFTPSVFRIYADSTKKVLLYSFKIQRWYIAQPSVQISSFNQAKSFCDSLGNGYRVPNVTDYTNANNQKYDWTGGIPDRLGNIAAYRRQISYRNANNTWIGGIFNEWGCVSSSFSNLPGGAYKCSGYVGTDWDTFYGYYSNQIYQGSNVSYKGNYFIVASNVGVVEPESFNRENRNDRAACVVP